MGERLAHEITLKATQGEDALFKGTIKMIQPYTTERLTWMEETQFDVTGLGENADLSAQMKNMPALARMIEKSQQFIKEIKLVKRVDGTKVTTFEQLNADPDAMAILMEIAGIMLNGFQPSKNSQPS